MRSGSLQSVETLKVHDSCEEVEAGYLAKPIQAKLRENAPV